MNFSKPDMDIKDINRISMLGLAHIGDSVYELLVRTMLCVQGHQSVTELHRLTVSRVNAPAQAIAAEKIYPHLDEDEKTVFKRGRNFHTSSTPKSATGREYHIATGLECLFGYLYLAGQHSRAEELFSVVWNASGIK